MTNDTNKKTKSNECVVPPRHHVVLVVTYTVAVICLIYIGTLAYCLITVRLVNETLGAFTHVGDTAIGALVGLLVRTSSDPVPTANNPLPTEIVNASDNSVPVHETPKQNNPQGSDNP